jgi:hypothetical protein
VARPGIRMGHWGHERTRMVLPHLRARPPRALRTRRSAPRRCGVRRPGGVPAARILEPLRLPPPGGRPVAGIRLLPAGGRPAGPALPGGRASDPGGEALHHGRERTGKGDDRGEPGRGASRVLRLFAPGGEAAGGGAPAGGAGAEEDGRDRRPAPGADGIGAGDRPTGWTGSDPPRPGRTRGRGSVDLGRADDHHGEPDAHHGLAGVRGLAEEGEGGRVPRAARRDRRAGAHGGAAPVHREAGEAEVLGAAQGEAGGADSRRGQVPVAAGLGWSLRIGGEAGGRPRPASRKGRPVDGGELQGPLQGP